MQHHHATCPSNLRYWRIQRSSLGSRVHTSWKDRAPSFFGKLSLLEREHNYILNFMFTLPSFMTVFFLQRDGASFLNAKSRKAFIKMGSLWSPFYFYRDSWFNLFVKGGKIHQDVLIPNMSQLNCSASPLNLHFEAQLLVPNRTHANGNLHFPEFKTM